MATLRTLPFCSTSKTRGQVKEIFSRGSSHRYACRRTLPVDRPARVAHAKSVLLARIRNVGLPFCQLPRLVRVAYQAPKKKRSGVVRGDACLFSSRSRQGKKERRGSQTHAAAGGTVSVCGGVKKTEEEVLESAVAVGSRLLPPASSSPPLQQQLKPSPHVAAVVAEPPRRS